jgi:ubiquinone/menaquinone biosynthesis C-methylase UbiE
MLKDPTQALLAQARKRDPSGDYRLARAEALPFPDAGFDLVVSYLTLIDIADFGAALREMARVLKPGGILLIANLNSFITSCPRAWIMDSDGHYLHYPVDRYLDEFRGGWNGRTSASSNGIARSPPTWGNCSPTG